MKNTAKKHRLLYELQGVWQYLFHFNSAILCRP